MRIQMEKNTTGGYFKFVLSNILKIDLLFTYYRKFSVIWDTNNYDFHGFGVAHVFWKYVYVVSARFTARSIFCEMATGDRLRVCPDFPLTILQNNHSVPNS